MAASRTRPGNPERGWNDPPMFNFEAIPQGAAPPRRLLNKRVAFPASGVAGPLPGHAVLNPNQGPPIVNPVLPADIQGPTAMISRPPLPVGLRDTPLGNQAAPTSPIQLLPPTKDTSTPQTVPVLVPLLIPSSPPKTEEQEHKPESHVQPPERLDELMARLSIDDDIQLLQHDTENFQKVLDRYRNILTLRVCDEIHKKLEIFEDRWRKGSLSDDVKVKISLLSIALVNEETDKVNHLHLALMVDHIAEVNQWMMGIKKLMQQQQLAIKEKEIIAENRQEINFQVDSAVLGSSVTDGEIQVSEENQENLITEVASSCRGSSGELGEATFQAEKRDITLTEESREANTSLSGEVTAENKLEETVTDADSQEVINQESCDKVEVHETGLNAADNVPESHSSDDMPESHSSDNTSESHSSDNTSESHSSDNTSESHSSDNMLESHSSDNTAESTQTEKLS